MALTGIDISSYQASIDLTQVPGDFVLIKATGGNGYVNPACDSQYNSARAAGKLIGLYHFAHEAGFQADPITEANFFIDNIAGYLVGDVILVLDFEGDNDWDVDWAKAFLDHVQARTGVKAVIYLNTAELRQSDWSAVYGADYGLWVASYAVTSPTQGYNNYAGGPAVDDSPPAVNWGGAGPMMWQYADNARLSGYNGGVDANVFYGDADTWHAYARPNGTPAPQTEAKDTFMPALTEQEQRRILAWADRGNAVTPDETAEILTTKHIADIWEHEIPLPGGDKTTTPARKVTYQKQEFNVIGAKIDALAAAFASVAASVTGAPVSKEEILGQLDKSVKDVLGDYTPEFVKADS